MHLERRTNPSANHCANDIIRFQTDPIFQILDLNGDCVTRFRPPARKSCPDPVIPRGGTELRLHGRMAYFWCDEGWDLYPEKDYAMCVLGQWDR